MLESEKRIKEIQALIQEHDISPRLLALISGLSRNQIRYIRSEKCNNLSPERYNLLKNKINEIIEGDIFDKYLRGSELPKRKRTYPNKTRIRKFLKANNIAISIAAPICNRTVQDMHSLLSTSALGDLSDKLTNEFLEKLEKYIQADENE